MYNKVILAGNITRDIELRYSQNGSAIAKTAIATSRKFTLNGEKKEETCFVDITFFGRSGEIANQYLQKGSKILVEGRLSFEQWVDQTSGQKRSKHSVIVETMQMLSPRQDGEREPYTPPEPTYEDHPQKQQPKHTDYQPKKQPMPQPDAGALPDMYEDEIPF